MGKILVVEDSSTMRRIIKNTLVKIGFNKDDILEAEDGVKGWELYRKYKDEIKAVLTDWNMPNMNGLELVKKIRAFEQQQGILGKGPQFMKDIKSGKGVKIVMITTEGGKDSVIEALKAGVNNYVVKPFTPQSLKEKLSQMKLI
ncbi:MAG: response regulator [Epsilonproteobacteria bacterium]|nr:response regulator [Campylobacterota bacterium]